MRKIKLSALIFSAAIFGVALQVRAYEKLPFYDTLPEWTLEWTNETLSKGTIATDAAHGGWKIHVQRDTSRYGGYSLTIYSPDDNRSVIEGSGYLDLRGVITGPSHDNDATNAVYREGARKAWFVDTPSPFDPNGLLLLLR